MSDIGKSESMYSIEDTGQLWAHMHLNSIKKSILDDEIIKIAKHDNPPLQKERTQLTKDHTLALLNVLDTSKASDTQILGALKVVLLIKGSEDEDIKQKITAIESKYPEYYFDKIKQEQAELLAEYKNGLRIPDGKGGWKKLTPEKWQDHARVFFNQIRALLFGIDQQFINQATKDATNTFVQGVRLSSDHLNRNKININLLIEWIDKQSTSNEENSHALDQLKHAIIEELRKPNISAAL